MNFSKNKNLLLGLLTQYRIKKKTTKKVEVKKQKHLINR